MTTSARVSATGGCDVGIVFAVAVEADAFERLASDRVELHAAGLVFREGLVAGRRVAWCVGGVGVEAAARAARLLIDGHRPRVLVSAGFAGGLRPELLRGALVRPTRVVDASGGRPRDLLESEPAAAVPITICTTHAIVRTPAEKHALAAATDAALVDMETHAVAGVALEAGIACAGVRVISDAADDTLPREVAALVAPQSSFRRLGAALGGLVRRPTVAADLWRLWEHAVVDARTLAAGLADVCRSVS
jgi:adenosylhomocysteine nucleosidase